MSISHLKKCADAAGITEEQAVTLIRLLTHPTYGQCAFADEYGADPMPPKFWPSDMPDEVAEFWRSEGWDGLTPGEWRSARYSRVWRLMCSALLSDCSHEERFPHPCGDLTDTRFSHALKLESRERSENGFT